MKNLVQSILLLLITNFGYSQCKTNPVITINIGVEEKIKLEAKSPLIEDLKYKWEPSIGLSCTNCITPEFTFPRDTIITCIRTIRDKNKKCIQIDLFKIEVYYPVEELVISKEMEDGPDFISISETVQEEKKDPADTIASYVDEDAYFSGYTEFLAKNMVYPQTALEEGLQGKCYLRCTIDKAGKISDVKVLKGVIACPECDKEAIRLIYMMPKWIPAKLNGKAVDAFHTCVIKFQID